jgi:AraC-like DNA-binding protein
MKPTFRKLPQPLSGSFILRTDDMPFNNPWHFHPEIELLYFHHAHGTRFIGDSVGRINQGELVLIGSNLPHVGQRDAFYYREHANDSPQVKIIQFLPDFLGKDFWRCMEMQSLPRLFEKAEQGLLYAPQDMESLQPRLLALADLQPAQRLLELLGILLELTKMPCQALASPTFVETYTRSHHHKLNKVYEYSVNHFMDKITIAEVAHLTHLSEAAFCRFFKQHTGKTYIEYLAELRIAFACKLLAENKLTIRAVAAECGYQNLSLFNRQFKALKGITPSQYISTN